MLTARPSGLLQDCTCGRASPSRILSRLSAHLIIRPLLAGVARGAIVGAMRFVYGRMVHVCQIQGHTQSLCARYASVRADWMVARLFRHLQSRIWLSAAWMEGRIKASFGKLPKRKVQANECTACMHPAGTQANACNGPNGRNTRHVLTAPSSSPACSKRPAERPTHVRTKD